MAMGDNINQYDNTPSYGGNTYNPAAAAEVAAIEGGLARYMNKVFTKMSLGLLVTFVTSMLILGSVSLLYTVAASYQLILIIQLALVIVMSFMVNKLSTAALNVCFFVYSVVTGCTIAIISIMFSMASVMSAFVATTAVFGGLAVVGYVTKKDLSRLGSILLAGLIAIILMSLVNIFILHSTGFDTAISVFAVLVFCGLTMYDVQKIKVMYLSAIGSGYTGDERAFLSKLSIMGALTLYLDFINIFIRLLSLFGKRR